MGRHENLPGIHFDRAAYPLPEFLRMDFRGPRCLRSPDRRSLSGLRWEETPCRRAGRKAGRQEGRRAKVLREFLFSCSRIWMIKDTS